MIIMKNNSNLIPEIKRTRGYFLYDTRGIRYIDLYQDNGRAVLGHRLDGISGVIKSTVARGLTAAYPSVYSNRLEKQLKLLFPGVRDFLVFRNYERAAASLFPGNRALSSGSEFVDFPSAGDKYGFWRPFTGSNLDWSIFRYFIPVLPVAGSFGPVVVCSNSPEAVPESDLLSPMFYDILIKSVVSLRKALSENSKREESLFNSPLWKRDGIYLRFKITGKAYSELFYKSLKCGVLLPPSPDNPGIIPLGFEPGQVRSFLNMVRSEYGS